MKTFRWSSFLLFVLVLLIGFAASPAFADTPPAPTDQFFAPTNTSAAVVVTVTEEAITTLIGDDTLTDAAPVIIVQQPPTPSAVEPGIPKDVVIAGLIAGGFIIVALVSALAYLQGKTGTQLYNSWPAPAQFLIRMGLEYGLQKAAETPTPDDDASIEGAARKLGFAVERSGSDIVLRRPPATPLPNPN